MYKNKIDKVEDFTYKIFSIFTNVCLPILMVGVIIIIIKMIFYLNK